MGEYAELYFRNEVSNKYGFDPGPQGGVDKEPLVSDKVKCRICSKKVKAAGLADHIKAVHQSTIMKGIK